MANIIGIAASAASGGLFGLAGTVMGWIAGFFERRQMHAHEQARWSHESELLTLQMAASAQETEAEIALAETAGSWRGLSAPVAAEAAIEASYPWVNTVRGLTRPFLTFLLWAIAGAIWFGADAAGRDAITETATFSATAATLWWFGDRGPRRDVGA